MDTLTAIEERRSVKHYDAGFVMPVEDEVTLLRLARLSPTSFNIQNWRFVVVKDKRLREDIKQAAWGQAQITDASLCIVLCGDLQSHIKDPARYWRNAPQQAQDALVPMIESFYTASEQLVIDEIHRSCGIAGQTLMLAAKSMGYDSCPMVGFDPMKVGEIIRLPKDHIISMIVVIGKALKPANARGGDIPDDEAVIIDHFA